MNVHCFIHFLKLDLWHSENHVIKFLLKSPTLNLHHLQREIQSLLYQKILRTSCHRQRREKLLYLNHSALVQIAPLNFPLRHRQRLNRKRLQRRFETKAGFCPIVCQVVKENYKGNKCKQKLLKQSLVWLMFFWVSTTIWIGKKKSSNMYTKKQARSVCADL